MAKKKTPDIKAALTQSQFEILLKVTKDVFFFSQFIYLIHPVRGKTKFDLFPFQKDVLYHFLTKRFNIVLKFRQAGITELISMYCLWLAMYHPNKNIVILSLKERVAKKVLRKIKYMYRNLPDFLKVDVINGRPNELGTAQEIEFANGSIISSIPTTEDAGRSEGLSLLVIDEAAIMKWAGLIWTAAYPTLSTGGAAIVNSTPYGTGTWYHQLWVNACSQGNEFFPIRLRWQMHPERYRFEGDMEWYNSMKAQMGPRKTAQEIDGDFLTSGVNVFDLADIRAIEDELDLWINIHHNPELRVFRDATIIQYKNFKTGEDYYIGADVSTGRSRDYSAFSIMDKYGEEYASFKGKIHPSQYADLLMEWGEKANQALLAPEGNDIGMTTVSKIDDSGYPHLYYSKALVRKKRKRRKEEKEIPGWYTTKQNRPVIISELEEDIRKETITIKDQRFVEEAYTFIYDEKNRAVALGKGRGSDDEDDDDNIYTDDTIIAKAITNHIRKQPIRSKVLIKPQ